MMAVKSFGDEDEMDLIAKQQHTNGGAIVLVGNLSSQPNIQLSVTSKICNVCFPFSTLLKAHLHIGLFEKRIEFLKCMNLGFK